MGDEGAVPPSFKYGCGLPGVGLCKQPTEEGQDPRYKSAYETTNNLKASGKLDGFREMGRRRRLSKTFSKAVREPLQDEDSEEELDQNMSKNRTRRRRKWPTLTEKLNSIDVNFRDGSLTEENCNKKLPDESHQKQYDWSLAEFGGSFGDSHIGSFNGSLSMSPMGLFTALENQSLHADEFGSIASLLGTEEFQKGAYEGIYDDFNVNFGQTGESDALEGQQPRKSALRFKRKRRRLGDS